MLKVCRIGVCNNSLLPAAWATSVMWRIGNRFRASLWQDKWAQTGNMNISPFLPTIGKRLAQRYALGLTCQLFDICSIYRFSSHLQPSPVCSDYRKAGLYGKHQQMPLSSGSWLALASGAPVKRSGSGKRMKEWNFSPALPAHSSVSRGCSSPGVPSCGPSSLEALAVITPLSASDLKVVKPCRWCSPQDVSASPLGFA